MLLLGVQKHVYTNRLIVYLCSKALLRLERPIKVRVAALFFFFFNQYPYKLHP